MLRLTADIVLAGWNGATCPTDSSRSPRSSILRKPLEIALYVVQPIQRIKLITRRSRGSNPAPTVAPLATLMAKKAGPSGKVYTIVYPAPMAKTVPVRELRSNLSSLLDDVSDRRDHVLVTRNGAPAAALVPIDEYEALEETAEILSDPDALAALESGLAEIQRGETVTLADLRSELAERRATLG